MKQIIGKRFIYTAKDNIDPNNTTLAVLKVIEDTGCYKVAALDGSTFDIPEKDLFEQYTAIRPSHVITYHRTMTLLDDNVTTPDLIITVAKYTDKDEDIVLVFDFFKWLIHTLFKRDGKWMIEDTYNTHFMAATLGLDENNSPIILNKNNSKEVYYCYLDSACGVPAITGLIPNTLIPYLYGKDNKLENYKDTLSHINISVNDLVDMNKFNDKIFTAIEFIPHILNYLGYVDVQNFYDKNVKGKIRWTAEKFYKELSISKNTWMKTMLTIKSKCNIYPGIPFLSLQGVDFDIPVIYNIRKETDEEIEVLKKNLATKNQFLMQYYFVEDCSIILVIYECKQPFDNSPAFTDEELAKFIKHKR